MEHDANCLCIACCPELHKCADCEECGAAIYPDFRLCEQCQDCLDAIADGKLPAEANAPTREMAEANARLIAAAPGLLAALEAILPMAVQYLWSAPSHPDNAKLEDAREAIRKATGA